MNTFIFRILQEVAKEQSLTKAAENLHITPSAISHAISSYEEDLGFPVFNRRRSSGVTLTKEGARVLHYGQQILDSEDALSQTVAAINGIEKGTVVLGAFTSVHMNWTADILSSFKAQYPKIDVIVYESNYADVLSNLQSGLYDLGFTTNPPKGMASIKVFSDPWMCILPASFKTASEEHVAIEELDWSQLIVPNAAYNDEILSILKKHRIKTRPRYFIDDVESVYKLVAKGLGFALFPKLMLTRAPKSARILPVFPRESRSIYLSCAGKGHMSPATEKLHDHIIAYMQQLPSITASASGQPTE